MKNNNKLMMAGVLTLTAGMVSQIVVPNYAYAAKPKLEEKIVKARFFKLEAKARYTTSKGVESIGHVYIRIEKDKHKLTSPNLITGEFFGSMEFVSEEADATYFNGEKTKTVIPILGDDGDIMLDLISSDKDYKTYQVYSCTSTVNVCSTENITINVENNKDYNMTIHLDQYSTIEFLGSLTKYNDDGTSTTTPAWTRTLEVSQLTEVSKIEY